MIFEGSYDAAVCCSFQVVNGSITLTLDVDEVVTLTTLNQGLKGQYPDPPPEKPFPLPYQESFDGRFILRHNALYQNCTDGPCLLNKMATKAKNRTSAPLTEIKN